ncbi:MAG: DUF2508 family protein [Clostridia bacterium]|nr:DUF2508 family protein [Clostridia bacterium]
MEEIFNDITNIEKKDANIFQYLLEKITKTKPEDTDTIELIKNLKNAQNEFETAVNNYEFANDPELVDYYTYNIKATQTRYQYLLKKAKEKGL